MREACTKLKIRFRGAFTASTHSTLTGSSEAITNVAIVESASMIRARLVVIC